jgi:hypothetical protein
MEGLDLTARLLQLATNEGSRHVAGPMPISALDVALYRRLALELACIPLDPKTPPSDP